MFETIVYLFHVVLYQPLFNALVVLYNYIPGHDFGVAIIVLTLIIRIILYPLATKTVKSQRNLQKLQPRLQEIQEKNKDNKEQQAKEILELYKKEKINPLSGIFLAIIQLPILIALYRVFWGGLNPNELSSLYSFVANPGQIGAMFLGIINLSKPNLVLAVLAGLVQYFQSKMLMGKNHSKQQKKNDIAAAMQKQTVFILPIFTILILISFPSALGLYWIASGLIAILQQYLIFKGDAKTEAVKVKN